MGLVALAKRTKAPHDNGTIVATEQLLNSDMSVTKDYLGIYLMVQRNE